MAQEELAMKEKYLKYKQKYSLLNKQHGSGLTYLVGIGEMSQKVLVYKVNTDINDDQIAFEKTGTDGELFNLLEQSNLDPSFTTDNKYIRTNSNSTDEDIVRRIVEGFKVDKGIVPPINTRVVTVPPISQEEIREKEIQKLNKLNDQFMEENHNLNKLIKQFMEEKKQFATEKKELIDKIQKTNTELAEAMAHNKDVRQNGNTSQSMSSEILYEIRNNVEEIHTCMNIFKSAITTAFDEGSHARMSRDFSRVPERHFTSSISPTTTRFFEENLDEQSHYRTIDSEMPKTFISGQISNNSERTVNPIPSFQTKQKRKEPASQEFSREPAGHITRGNFKEKSDDQSDDLSHYQTIASVIPKPPLSEQISINAESLRSNQTDKPKRKGRAYNDS
jgi:hypothetical protein